MTFAQIVGEWYALIGGAAAVALCLAGASVWNAYNHYRMRKEIERQTAILVVIEENTRRGG